MLSLARWPSASSGRTVYRVRLGPFGGRDEAEATQGKLAEAGIEASLVRVER
jgi:cell division protein FtsN